jgi:ABC-type dipeptide/oligopeptide/nickel transport system ATPase subunit
MKSLRNPTRTIASTVVRKNIKMRKLKIMKTVKYIKSRTQQRLTFMKIQIAIIFLFFMTFSVIAQNDSIIKTGKEEMEIGTIVVEQMPEFIGGLQALQRYINSNATYTEKAKNEKVTGKVFLSFWVETDGRSAWSCQSCKFTRAKFNIKVAKRHKSTFSDRKLQKMSSIERHKAVMDALEWVGLTEKVKSKPSMLSGGESQRVAIARAMVKKPKIVLADEPTANLDSKNSHHILQTMKQLNEELNVTFIFATHDEKVMKYLDRMLNLADGKVISDEIISEKKKIVIPC